MTVAGSTTAVVASVTYVPPYKYVTSYGPAPSVTGTVTGPVSNNPTLAPGTSAGDYAWAYLSAHMMSWPSYRYIYLLWIILTLIALIYTLVHHLHLGSSSFGAMISKWAIRRYPIGKRRSGGARGRALASNGVLLTSLLLFIIATALSFIGSDYIAPTSKILSFSRRQFLQPGQIQYASPSYTIPKSIWTIASRLGDTAFALIPLTVLLAMKPPPVAILAWRGLAHLYSDKLATFHKITAWMVWVATTAHVALWTVQLFMDKRNGTAAWFAMWTNYRFIAGAIAYAAMTGVMVTSFRIVRQKRYEFFYIAHVTLVFLTITLAALHHPVLWFWMAAALGLWALERLYRQIRFWRINGLTSPKSSNSHSRVNPKSTLLASQYEDLPQSDSYAMADLPSRGSYIDKSLPRPPGGEERGEWSPASTPRGSFDMARDEFGSQHFRGSSGGYAEGSLQPLGAFDGRYSRDTSPVPGHGGFTDPYDRRSGEIDRNGRGGRREDRKSQLRVVSTGSHDITAQRNSNYSTTQPSSSSTLALAPIPVGYALAQLLPSRTIRLTIHLPKQIKWSPGQSVLLSLPELSKLQSHPFTITNLPNSEGEVILLVKARKGLTRTLYELVKNRHQSNMRLSAGGGGGGERKIDSKPVFIRTKVDGPFGSAARVKWGDHSTIVIICGGSGVSFGMAVLEGVCRDIGEGRGRKTTRIRFCWIAREYAEIAWVAHQLQRCQSLISPSQLQIEIFITNAVPLPSHSRHVGSNRPRTFVEGYDQPSAASSADDLAPPRAAFAKSTPRARSPSSGNDGGFGRSASMDSISSITSDMSIDSPHGRGYSDSLEVDEHISENYADVIDLTNYEDEEDMTDPREEELSSKVREQGKIRRAKSRKVAGRVQGEGGRRASGLVPPMMDNGMPASRLSGLGRNWEDQAEEERGRKGMSDSTSVPQGLSPGRSEQEQHLYQPSPRSGGGGGRSNQTKSAYDTLQPADNLLDPYAEYDTRRTSPRPATTYDPTIRPNSTSSNTLYSQTASRTRQPSNNSLAPPAILPLGPNTKRGSYASSLDSYAAYDPFNGVQGMGPNSPGTSIRHSYYDDGDKGSIAGDSIRPIYPEGAAGGGGGGGLRASRTGSMILLDEAAFGSTRSQRDTVIGSSGSAGTKAIGTSGVEGLWIDMADYESMGIISELAIAGKPALGVMLEEEIERAEGGLIVTTCGPTTLNTVVRNLVSKHINPARIRNGDKRGNIAIYSEDYDG